jgi:hypothetical protein
MRKIDKLNRGMGPFWSLGGPDSGWLPPERYAETTNGKPPHKQPGFIYLIRCTATGLLKIGLSRNPPGRLRQLRCSSSGSLELVAILEATVMADLESDLHSRFADLRHHGEWFRPSPQILAAFASGMVP